MRRCLGGVGLFTLTIAAAPAWGAGIVTHGEAVQRARYFFDSPDYPEYEQYVAAHEDALQAGASFPDWGYACGFDDAAEEAHWNPFLQASAAYIHATYPKPWDEETQKLAVFLLSVTTHSVSDISWHGLGVEEGFIDVISDQEFEGDWGKAHTWADTGGDMVGDVALDLDYLTFPWYIPVRDLVQIYHSMGYDEVSAGWMVACNYLIFLGAVGERIAGQAIFPHFATDSAFLVERYQDYFVGGMDDMAIHSAWMWDEVIYWMETGDTTRVDLSARLMPTLDWEHDSDALGYLDRIDTGGLDVVVEKTPRGVTFRVIGDLATQPARPAPRPVPARTQAGGAEMTLSQSEHELAYLGAAMAAGDFDGGGYGDLAVGSPGASDKELPQRGRVYVLSGQSWPPGDVQLDLSMSGAARVLEGGDEYGRFGAALAVVDFDRDGYDDLAVGEPTLYARDLAYLGRVSIYRGGVSGLGASPTWWVEGNEDYMNLGAALASADLDGDGAADLIVGAPYARQGGTQRGRVLAFLSGRHAAGALALSRANWSKVGPSDYAWFGASLAVGLSAQGHPLLVVGAPGENAGSESQGRVYGFDLNGVGSGGASGAPVFVLTGAEIHQRLGSSLAAGSLSTSGAWQIAVGSSALNAGGVQRGGTFVVGLDGLQGEVTLGEGGGDTFFAGSDDFGRLGLATFIADLNGDDVGDLLVAQPFAGSRGLPEEGEVYLYEGGVTFPTGDRTVSPVDASRVFSAGDDRSRFGAVMAAPDLDGDGIADLAVSAPQDSTHLKLGGTVTVLLSGTSSAQRRAR